jgi:hypothetical protein
MRAAAVRSEKQVAEGQFGNLQEGEHLSLEAATKQWLVKSEKTLCVLKTL